MRKMFAASAVLAFVLAAAPIVAAQQTQTAALPPDALSDPSMKGPEVIAFIGVKPGDKVADIVAGRFVRALS